MTSEFQAVFFFIFLIKTFLLATFFMINKLRISFILIEKVNIQLRCNNNLFFFPGLQNKLYTLNTNYKLYLK